MGLTEDVETLMNDRLEEKSKKIKKFKIPAKGRVSPAKARQNYVTVMKLNENGHWDFKRHQIDDQTVIVEGIPRLATSQYVTYYKKNPIIILPSWSVEPFSPEAQYKKSLNDGSNTKGYKLLFSRMKSELVPGKKKIGGMGMTVFGMIIAAIIGYAMITGGG